MKLDGPNAVNKKVIERSVIFYFFYIGTGSLFSKAFVFRRSVALNCIISFFLSTITLSVAGFCQSA